MKDINSQRISGGTFFKLLLVGAVFTHVLTVAIAMLGIFLGMFSPDDMGTAAPVWGSQIFALVYLIVGIIFMPLWAAVFWVALFPGIWLYSKFQPMVLTYKPAP